METAKVIENIQRDLNIALMNDIFIFSNKMGSTLKIYLDLRDLNGIFKI